MMKILLTNDDGIDAEGLRVVADWAKNLGHVTVCAPKVQQSGKSHAINIYTPFEIKKVDYEGADEAYAVDSSPADCVRFGTIGLGRHYDLVLSGVNKGLNMGEDIMYSGTAGAITISVPNGYELVSVKVSTKTGTYAFLYLGEGTTDICNVETAVSGQSIVLNSVKNGTDGKQVRVTAIEVVYRPVQA